MNESQKERLLANIRLGKSVSELRKSAGLTQTELADSTGLYQVQVSRIESGHSPLDALTALRIADYFSVSVEKLLRGATAVPK